MSARTEQDYLEDNIATIAFHMGRPGARLSITNDISGLIVDPGEVLKEASRRLSTPADQAVREADPDHPDCSTDRECELYDALMGLASHAAAWHRDYKQWTQGGVTLEPIVSKALRLGHSLTTGPKRS